MPQFTFGVHSVNLIWATKRYLEPYAVFHLFLGQSPLLRFFSGNWQRNTAMSTVFAGLRFEPTTRRTLNPLSDAILLFGAALVASKLTRQMSIAVLLRFASLVCFVV